VERNDTWPIQNLLTQIKMLHIYQDIWNQIIGYTHYHANDVLEHVNQLLDRSKPKIIYLIMLQQ
jgi:hypothetical protein